MTETMTVKAAEPVFDPLTLADRCDRCGAQAFVRSSNEKGYDLLHCGHHYNRYEPMLIAQGFAVVEDKREFINSKPSPSATMLAESAETPPDEDF